jgi:PadR family transcriptional regulator PadR|tara:strand:- start:1014 stop:1454 length:441 start_codon:yes stop_codon:yes gene_type:complete
MQVLVLRECGLLFHDSWINNNTLHSKALLFIMRIMNENTYQKWLSQLRKGYLELCVLVMLNKKQRSYGFEMLQLLNQAGVEINEGTLYPLLNRMEKNNWLSSVWETPTLSGHPRRFYELNNEGKELLPKMQSAFEQSSQFLTQLKE